MTTKEKEIVEKHAVGDGYVSCWYLDSIDNTKSPVWTQAHIDELLSDFYLIPKDRS